MTQVRSIYLLTLAEIRQCAREQADAGEPCLHGFEPTSPQALAFERAHLERVRELEPAVAS